MIDELKPCPFCSGEPRVFSHNNEWIGRTWHIECLDDNCGCGTCHHESEKIAATVWNRRVSEQTTEIERLIQAGDGDVGLIHWQGEEIERLRKALAEIARIRTDLHADFSLASRQSDIARKALGGANG